MRRKLLIPLITMMLMMGMKFMNVSMMNGKQAPEHSVDLNRSQYDSGNDEFPLNTFNEYIKVEESNGDSNIIYICTA